MLNYIYIYITSAIFILSVSSATTVQYYFYLVIQQEDEQAFFFFFFTYRSTAAQSSCKVNSTIKGYKVFQYNM